MYFICFDIGAVSVKYGLLNDGGYIVDKSSYPTPKSSKEAFYKEIVNKTQEYCLKHEISGICLSISGIVNSKIGTVTHIYSLPIFEGVNIKAELEELLEIDVSIENEAKCAALAEVWQGSAKNYKDLIFIIVGSRISGAIIKNRKIHHGSNLYSGDFGMMLLNCKNSQFEVWSNLASTTCLVKNCSEKLGVEYNQLNGEKVFELADKGNKTLEEEIQKFYHYLAVGIYNLQFIYDPQAIIIGGGISKREDLIENIHLELNKIFNATNSGKNITIIKNCEFTEDANLIGALYNFLYS